MPFGETIQKKRLISVGSFSDTAKLSKKKNKCTQLIKTLCSLAKVRKIVRKKKYMIIGYNSVIYLLMSFSLSYMAEVQLKRN